MYWLIDILFPTSVGITTFVTIMLLALTTNCDGGALLARQRTHICLILSLIVYGGWVAFISPNMRRAMVPCAGQIPPLSFLPFQPRMLTIFTHTQLVLFSISTVWRALWCLPQFRAPLSMVLITGSSHMRLS